MCVPTRLASCTRQYRINFNGTNNCSKISLHVKYFIRITVIGSHLSTPWVHALLFCSCYLSPQSLAWIISIVEIDSISWIQIFYWIKLLIAGSICYYKYITRKPGKKRGEEEWGMSESNLCPSGDLFCSIKLWQRSLIIFQFFKHKSLTIFSYDVNAAWRFKIEMTNQTCDFLLFLFLCARILVLIIPTVEISILDLQLDIHWGLSCKLCSLARSLSVDQFRHVGAFCTTSPSSLIQRT